MSLHNFLLFHFRSHIKNSCFVFHQGFQTPRNNKSTRPAASCFHYFLGVWNSWWNTRTRFWYITCPVFFPSSPKFQVTCLNKEPSRVLLFGCNSKKTRLNFLNNLYGYNRSDNVFYYNGATFSSVHFRYSQHLLYTSILLMTKQKTRRTWLQDNFWVTIPGFLSLDSLNFSHRLLNKRDLTTRRLSHDGAVGSPYSIARRPVEIWIYDSQ